MKNDNLIFSHGNLYFFREVEDHNDLSWIGWVSFTEGVGWSLSIPEAVTIPWYDLEKLATAVRGVIQCDLRGIKTIHVAEALR